MPFIRNLTAVRLNLKRVGREIEAHAVQEVSKAEAELLRSHPLLHITPSKPKTAATKKDGE